jgi:KAP family P-loop domain
MDSHHRLEPPSGISASATTAQYAKILLDMPSREPALQFDRTARAFARVITDNDPRFAIGIFGKWGSGKTTLMQAIRCQLPTDKVVATEFNAWRFEREPLLLVPLIDTIREGLAKWSTSQDKETRKLIRGVLSRTGRVVRGLASGLSGEVGIPAAVKIHYDVSKAMDVLSAGNRNPNRPQSLYLGAFRELSEAFGELTEASTIRIVVFIDDLDRCLPVNALDVLESIKLFFDLPGFVFVVGLDEGVVQRAVRARFSADSEAAIGGIAGASARELGRDYVEKIFQVPYRIPPMVTAQLDGLLESMCGESDLPTHQLTDFRNRVAPHLSYLAEDWLVNPREVKRFLNTYTLQTLVREDLDRDVVLALQTLNFRHAWRPLYDAILTDSILFQEALTRYRDGQDSAFADLSPELRELPVDLGKYLRSDLAAALHRPRSLYPYLSSLESYGAREAVHVVCPVSECDNQSWVAAYSPSTVTTCNRHGSPRKPMVRCQMCARFPGYHLPDYSPIPPPGEDEKIYVHVVCPRGCGNESWETAYSPFAVKMCPRHEGGRVPMVRCEECLADSGHHPPPRLEP